MGLQEPAGSWPHRRRPAGIAADGPLLHPFILLRGAAHPAAVTAHVIADHRSLSPRGSEKRQAFSARTPEDAGRGALRMSGGQQAPLGGTADAVGGGARRRAGPRAHHVAPGSPEAVAGSPRRPPHSPCGWRKPFSPSAPPCPLTSDLRPHCLRVTPRRRSRGVFINRPPGGSEIPDRWIPPQGNGASAHAHPRVHPRLRTEAQRR